MPDFDPFSGGSSFGGNSLYKKKKKVGASKYVKKILPILIVAVIIFLAVKYIFFYNIEISNITLMNTEDEIIDNAQIIFQKDGDPSNSQTFDIYDDVVLRKGVYDIKIKAEGYNIVTKSNVDLTGDTYSINEILQKNIKLNILGMTFPQTVFKGQKIISKINVENKSATQKYTAENIIFESDVNINYYFCDSQGILRKKEHIQLKPKTNENLFVCFELPDDLKIGNTYSIQPRIKYLKAKSEKKEFVLKDKPNISVSIDSLEKEYVIGKTNSITFIYTINNNKNDVLINDMKIDLEIESTENSDLNVEQWFSYNKNQISIDPNSIKEDTIEVVIPNNAKAENLSGKFIFNSENLLEEAITKKFSIELKEPNIDYSISLDKDDVTLEYDVNNTSTNIIYPKLTINNNNEFPLDIQKIEINNPTSKKDCNKLLHLSPGYVRTIYSKTSEPILFEVNANIDEYGNEDPSYLQSIDIYNPNDLTRICEIRIYIEHPFREDQVIETAKNIEITIVPIE